jgi:F-type H+-transporting ATPase subunit epsilon
MAGTFPLSIVTPEREVFSAPVQSISLPGVEGAFGIMAGHAPIMAALDAGLVVVRDAENGEQRMAVGGGFFQMVGNQATLLADSVEMAGDIDASRARESEQRATSRLAGQMEPAAELQRERAEAALKRARARLRVATGGR